MSTGCNLESRPAWLDYPETQKLIRMFNAPMYFRGGAVRDSLLGVSPHDIDLIVDLPRQKILELLKVAGSHISPGVDNTWSVETTINGIEYDIMPAKPDDPISAASIARTGGASCGDFTINSIYLSPEGELLDYYGGVDDLLAGRVRLAGDARQRIMENYANIIKFFRFHARYGIGDPDPIAVELCAAYASHIPEISARIIDKHMFYLLLVPKISEMLELMRSLGVLNHIFGFTIKSCELVARLETVEALSQTPPDSHTRLIALLLSADILPLMALEHIRLEWDMPDESYGWKYNILTLLPYFSPDMTVSVQESLRKKLGVYAFKRLLLLGWAMEPEIDKSIVELL